MFYDHLATAIENAGRNQLDECSRQVSRALGVASVTDDQAERLYDLIQVRRGSGPARGLAASTPTVGRYFIQRSPDQRSPDRRASLLRRRQHAYTGPLPPSLAANFTPGELAVLKIVGDECLAHGACDRSRNEIGARAGVSMTIVKRAIRYAERDSLIKVVRRPRPGRKNLTNIITIIRADWIDWLSKGGRKTYAKKACDRAKPDFVQGARMNPPRAQDFRNSSGEPVEMSGEKRNRTVAGRSGP